MENKVLAQNLKQIEHYNINLFNEILMLEIKKSNLQLAQNENQEYNLLLDDVPLHSTISAINEANNICSNFEDNFNSIKIIYGLGLGYLIDSASNKIQKGKIIVYETNLELIKFVFSIAQIDAFSKENVVLITNKKDLYKYVLKEANETSSISISFLNSYKKDIEDIKDVLYQAQKAQGEIIGNKNTFIKKAPDIFSKTLKNLKYIFKNPLIEDLKDIYKGKTALILCAGPSLKENIEIIKNNQDKFVIFALNPTLEMLQKNNIKPDFIVAVENSSIIKQFEGFDCSNCYFITDSFVDSDVLDLKKKKLFSYISNENFFNYWILDIFKQNEKLKNEGTVSYTATMSAFIMGFDKIILIGQDLAFKDGLCYSKECQWGELSYIFDEETKKYKIIVNDREKFAKACGYQYKTTQARDFLINTNLAKKNQNLCSVKGQKGGLLPSKNDYAIFIKCFENLALDLYNKKPEIELINSSFGAQIDGFKNISLEEITENLEPIEKLNLDNFEHKIDKELAISKIDKLLGQLEIYIKYLENFNSVNKKIIKELKNKNVFTPNIVKYLKKHKEILNQIVQLSKEYGIGFIVNIHLKQCEKYFKVNYFENEELSKRYISSFSRIFEARYLETKESYENLSNSKTFILQ